MTVTRGCGVRQAGAAYAEVRPQRAGLPLEAFLRCPPVPVDPDALEIPSRGVVLRPRQDGSGVWDVWDRIGQAHYPNVADFIEELRRFGASRRLARTLDFAKLDQRSALVLLHDRAIITDPAPYWRDLRDQPYPLGDSRRPRFCCPKGHVDHRLPGNAYDGMCAALWYEDVTDGEPIYDPTAPARSVARQLPSFAYVARRAPDDADGRHACGIVAVLPITNLAVIRDRLGGSHVATKEAADKSRLPVVEEDE